MDFGPALVALINKVDSTHLILLILLAGCAWWHYVKDKQNREDRQSIVDSNNKLAEALGALKNVISASTGKAV